MVSLYGILNLGARGVSAAQSGINTTGQNIANANTEGYSRQRVDQQAVSPLVLPNGAFGQGVDVISVERIRDSFLEGQIRGAASDSSYNEELNNIFVQLDQILNDPLQSISDSLDGASTGGLNNLLSRFFQSMHDLSLSPEAPELRSAAIESAVSLSETFNLVGDQLRGMKSDLNERASTMVDEVNRMTSEIASLNRRIAVSEVGAAVNANDLRDQRDRLLSQLSELIPITTVEQSNGAIDVNLAGERIVDGVNNTQLVKITTDTPDQLPIMQIRIGKDGLDVKDEMIRKGELGAVLDARDRIVPSLRTQVDTLARGVIYEVNKIHSEASGLTGQTSLESHFAIPAGSTAANSTQTLDQVFNNPRLKSTDPLSSYPYPVQDGAFTIRVTDEDNQTRDLYDVNVKTTDTLYDIVERINRTDGIVQTARSAYTFDPVYVRRATATVGISSAETNTGLGALNAAAGTPISETPGAYSMEIHIHNAAGAEVDSNSATPDVEPFTINFDDTMTLNQLANQIQNNSGGLIRALVVPSAADPAISVLQIETIDKNASFSIQNDTSGLMQAFDFPTTDPSIPLIGGNATEASGKFFGRSDQSFLGNGIPAFSPAFPGPPPSVISEGSFDLVVLDNNNVPTITTITVQAGALETMDDVAAAIQAADPNLNVQISANNELQITSSNNRSFFFQNDRTGLVKALGLKDLNGFGDIGGQPFSDGSFEIVVGDANGKVTHIVEVPVKADPSTVGGVLTLQGVVDAINAATGAANVPITASIEADPKNKNRSQLVVSASNGFEFTFRSDDSSILSALGFTDGPLLDATGDNPIQGAEFPVTLGDDIGALVRAHVENNSQIVIETSNKERITFTGDTSNFLAAAGINSLFHGTDSRSMRVNQDIIDNNDLLAASGDGTPGNNEAAYKLANLESESVLDGNTLGEYYRSTISKMGIESSRAKQFYETHSSVLRELKNFQEQNSGVSLDEESINIIRFQQAFQASARVISTVDDLLNTIINQIGR
ncbi:MAG: flagellar hook-associated protein FlgK [bacterium]|nr:flagellar hook-associated protein FlgK [bacterium]